LDEKIKKEEKNLKRIEKEESYIQNYMDSIVRIFFPIILLLVP
jgi:hypothetical protein